MAQLVKCQLYKHEHGTLLLIPSIHFPKQVLVRQRQADCWVLRASLSYQASSKLMRDPVSKNKGGYHLRSDIPGLKTHTCMKQRRGKLTERVSLGAGRGTKPQARKT